ncbi:23S rRNA (adenine(2030)-N(6))-methyltransferase RlmJ [Kiloniella laminariae]|uniref:23S rRNA (adenine(2030)-N(6))-methyltransferase RlmJ n=1 Tax=Kiloniella laminariae TaxID=454162 RepID=UPI000378D512|nr:23S rRNA (adenine(2030)-N(6))-methyltransferase RlmJ [Kiloniella laminariae]
MLSYQHLYHAGCIADVHKHAALSIVLSKLTEKHKPLHYMETHAGRGVYDLTAPESEKTGEAKEGILKVLEKGQWPKKHPYFHTIRETKKKYGPDFYPGSPEVAHCLLRQNDHLHLMELHPGEFFALKSNMRARNIHLHHQDGYEGVMALSPPESRRGLVLIDPSYEVKSEYKAAADFILKLHNKWPEAVIILWYPLLKDDRHKEMSSLLEKAELPKFRHEEIVFADRNAVRGMYGSGLIYINLPSGIEDALIQSSKLQKL